MSIEWRFIVRDARYTDYPASGGGRHAQLASSFSIAKADKMADGRGFSRANAWWSRICKRRSRRAGRGFAKNGAGGSVSDLQLSEKKTRGGQGVKASGINSGC